MTSSSKSISFISACCLNFLNENLHKSVCNIVNCSVMQVFNFCMLNISNASIDTCNRGVKDAIRFNPRASIFHRKVCPENWHALHAVCFAHYVEVWRLKICLTNLKLLPTPLKLTVPIIKSCNLCS